MSKSTNSFIYAGIELPIEVKKKWGYKTYKVGDRRLGFRSKWRRNVIRSDRARLSSMGKSRKSDICIIIGNGPSLNEIDFTSKGGLLEVKKLFNKLRKYL